MNGDSHQLVHWPFDEITTQHLGMSVALLIAALASWLKPRRPGRRR